MHVLLAPPRRLVQTSRMLRHGLFLVALLGLTACGFHLRNALTLPADLGPLRVHTPDPYSPLGDQLERALTGMGAQVAPEPDGVADTTGEDHIAQLTVLQERWGDIPIAVDTQGRAQEFTLGYAVIFNLTRADGSVLVPDQAIELGRDYVVPPTDSLGSASERELLVREMRRDMVATILRRINAVIEADVPVPQNNPQSL